MFRERASLLKVGVILMALALALVIGAVVIGVGLRSETGQAAAEVAKKALGETPWAFFGGEGNAAEKSSSEGETRRLASSGEDGSPGNGSSSRSGGSVGQGKGKAKETQGMGASEPSSSRSAVSRPPGERTASGAFSDPELQPQQNQTHPGGRILSAGQRTASGPFSEHAGDSRNELSGPPAGKHRCRRAEALPARPGGTGSDRRISSFATADGRRRSLYCLHASRQPR